MIRKNGGLNFGRYRKLLVALQATTGLIAFSGTALAQEESKGPVGLEDIVVTAQKRSESLQRTPLAISAVSADTIETRRITDASMLSSVAPNLTTTTGPSTKGHLIVQIRGVGESEPILTADSPVGVYVDGVIVGRSTGSVFELVDLERIEVLRGPQGTLYGRNTTGGAVSLITKKPSDEFGLEMLGSYGVRGYWQGRASVDTGQFGDSGFAAKFSYLHKQANGFVDNIDAKSSRDPGAYNTDAFRAALKFDKGGSFRANYAFDWAETKAVATLSQLAAARPDIIDYFSQSEAMGGTPFILPSTKRLKRARPDVTATYDRNISHTFTAEADLTSDLTIRMVTGYREWKNSVANTDLDGNSGLKGLVVSPAPAGVKPIQLFGADNHRRQYQFSQEFNLLGEVGDSLEYVLGAFYFFEKSHEENPQAYTFVREVPGVGLAGINLTNTVQYTHKNESQAVFGQATYKFNDKLSFTGGLRYTADEKKLIQQLPFNRQLDRNFSRLNYSATLTYQATPDVMGYARVASGYKAGGFNPRAINNGYDPESVTNYEVGVKSEMFDRRLRLNGTLFYMDLKDKQLNQLVAGTGGASTQTINAGAADFKGVELEMEALPFEGLRLNAAFGYVDRNFSQLMALNPVTNQLEDYSDIAAFSYSASTTANVGGEYTFGDVMGGTLSARLDYAYKSRVRFNILPGAPFTPFDADIIAPAYGLLDGRIMLASVPMGGTEASFTLWGKNLTNKVYRTSGIDFGSLGFAVSNYGEPRSYGVDMKVKF